MTRDVLLKLMMSGLLQFCIYVFVYGKHLTCTDVGLLINSVHIIYYLLQGCAFSECMKTKYQFLYVLDEIL